MRVFRALGALAVGGIAVVGLASCSLLVDLDGLSGGETARIDAATDAATDASITDAAAEDAPAFRLPCPANAFCDDFDEGGISPEWTSTLTTGGTLTVVEGQGRSLPSALRSYLFAGGTSDKRAQLVKDFGARTSLRCSFSLWMGPTNVDTDIMGLTWTTETGKTFFTWLDSRATRTLLGRAFTPSGPYYSDVDFPLLPRAQWVDIVFETDFTSIDVRIGGALVHRGALMNGTTGRATGVRLELGGFSGEDVENEFLYDDVRCE